MKVIKLFFLSFIFLFASETVFISSINPIEDIYGRAPKTSSFNAQLTDDSLWIKVDSFPLPSIGSNDAWTGLKVYGDTVYIVLNQVNMPFQVQKRNRLTGELLSYFNGNTTPSYAMSAVRVDDSIFVSVFYPSPEHIEVYSANGTYVRSFNAPAGFRCRGMDWDGSKFWVCNSQTYANTIYTMTREGTLLRNLTNTGPVTCYWFFDMTLDRMIPNRLWVNDQESPYVTRYISFDTITNIYQVNATFTHPGSPSYYPEGIGFYGPEGGNGYIYTVGHASPWAWKMLVHISTGIEDVYDSPKKPTRMPLILKDVENISIYDATGKLLKRINKVDKELIWDGKDNKGNTFSYGIYFLKLKTKEGILTEKVIITK